MIPGSATPFLLAKSGDGEYKIERSLRFNDGDSAYLNRTPSSAGNQTKFTWSGWIKRTEFGGNKTFFSSANSNTSSPRTDWQFFDDTLYITFNPSGSSWLTVQTIRKFRDPSAWYHIVVAVDTSESTNTDRVKIYVNGERETSLQNYSTLPQYSNLHINSANQHALGRYEAGDSNYFPGYLADVHFIDGQALTPSDFGKYDNKNIWQPKKYAGGYNDWFDTSQTWSGLWTGSAGYGSFANLHDTNLTNYMQSLNATLTLSSAIPVTSLRILLQRYGTTGTSLSINGTDVSSQLPSAPSGQVWVDITGVTSLTSINVTSGDYQSNTLGLYAIEVNGKLLLDSGTSVANNSFHLDFSDNSTNAALGTDSSGSNNTWTVNNISAIDAVGSIYAEFSGSSNQYLRNNSGNVLPGSNGAFTIECHFYPHTTNVIGLFDGGSGSTSIIRNYGNNTIEKQSGGAVNFAGDYTQNAWNHIAVVYTGSTSNDRLIVYVNGVESGYAGGLNGFTPGSTFDIGTINNGGDGRFDGYIRNFRVTHAVVYSSDFTAPSHNDNISAITDTKLLVLTTPALGLTGAGSGTTLTLSNNGSVSSGTLTPASETDSVIDTPTDYETGSGNNAGNYCTLSPLKNAQTLSNGNLDVVGGSSWQRSVGSIGMYSGKYYWEYTITASNEHLIGVGPPNMQLSGNLGAGSPPGSGYGTELGFVNGTGANGSWSNTGASGAGDVIGIAFDADNGNMYVYKNGTALNSGTASHTGLVMPQIPVVSLNGSSRSGTINFGQRPFKYTPPTGYKSLCTTNLPEPTIADGSTAFDAKTFTANNGSQSISLGFAPDLVWTKSRAGAYNHQLFDILRGDDQELRADTTNASRNLSNSLTFDSSGFTMPSNNNNANYGSGGGVAWAWDAGTTNTTVAVDANGSGLPGAECVYRVNTSTGFSIVRVANPTSTQTRVHGLNKKPDLIICKSTGSSDSWHTYHSSLGYTQYLNLNGTSPATSSDQFGSQEPTSTYFYVKSNTGSGANKSDGMIYYIWTAVEGYSAFGSYTGNGSTDGPFVYTGFRSRFVLIKETGSSNPWFIYDTARNTYNTMDNILWANSHNSEATIGSGDGSNQNGLHILSNGFKIPHSLTATNRSSGSFIYAAFAEHPFKTARAR